MKRTKIVLAAMFLLVWSTATARSALPQGRLPLQARPAKRVKALLIGATNDRGIGKGCAANLKALELYLRGLPKFDPKSDLIVVKGEVTPTRVMQAVARLRVRPDETVFCYVACHGGYDQTLAPNDPSGGHLFQLPGGSLRRMALLNALTVKGGRLTVLLSDTCNVSNRGRVRPWASRQVYPGKRPDRRMPKKAGPVSSRAFAELLFRHAGVVDVSGSSRDQYGWYNSEGGWFTIGLLATLEDYDTRARLLPRKVRAEGHTCDWSPFLQKSAENVSSIFHNRKKRFLRLLNPKDPKSRDTRRKLDDQEDQCPQSFQLQVYRGR